MKFGEPLRRYWPEMLLFLAVALPWLSLLALGSVWLWQGGHVWAWSIATAVLGLLAWPLSRSVQRRAKSEARLALVLLRHKPLRPHVSCMWSTAGWAARQASYDSGDEPSAHGRD
jgi:hypothetical protein